MKAAATPNMPAFKRAVWARYRTHGRDMPWRRDTSPYAVAVSEIMLQQTQVSRVLVKFPAFMKRFPGWQALARASTADVLREWSGLGYNRRALYLKRIAETLVAQSRAGGTGGAAGTTGPDPLPRTYDGLRALPGIGPNTAGSILAFAFNVPHPFIETNIRSVFIHFFFARARTKVRDDRIMPLIRKALEDRKIATHPRQWYWALMDYGAYLKSRASGTTNPSRRSAHHARQKPFKGSTRELRSRLLRAVMTKPLTKKAAHRLCAADWPKDKIEAGLNALVREGFIARARTRFVIAS